MVKIQRWIENIFSFQTLLKYVAFAVIFYFFGLLSSFKNNNEPKWLEIETDSTGYAYYLYKDKKQEIMDVEAYRTDKKGKVLTGSFLQGFDLTVNEKPLKTKIIVHLTEHKTN